VFQFIWETIEVPSDGRFTLAKITLLKVLYYDHVIVIGNSDSLSRSYFSAFAKKIPRNTLRVKDGLGIMNRPAFYPGSRYLVRVATNRFDTERKKMNTIKIGILICHRYHTCAGGKCFRALRQREGGFQRYQDQEIEFVGYTSCGGCPGGNVEYAPEEMKKNGAEVIHLATGLIVGYPPCPRIVSFSHFIATRYSLEVVTGTHPIPQKYYLVHQKLETWDSRAWKQIIQSVLTDEKTRLAYD
jgi:predicted metal-binding protein